MKQQTDDKRLTLGDIVYIECNDWNCESQIAEIVEIQLGSFLKGRLTKDHCSVECLSSKHQMWVVAEDLKTIDEYNHMNDFQEKIEDRIS